MSTEAAPIAQPLRDQPKKKLRIWPAIPLLAFIVGAKIWQLTATEWTRPMFMLVLFGPLLCAAAIPLWWLFASRAAWRDRLLGLVGLAVIGLAAFFLTDPSMHGMPFMVFVVPIGVIAFTTALLVLSPFGSRIAAATALVAAALGFGYWDLMRFDGMSGDFKSTLHWRWETTAEDRFLASVKDPAKPAADGQQAPLGPVLWPQFRGPNRDAVLPGVVLDADWSAHAPKQVWKHKVGPAWSSFSIAGDRLFTQEQRGPNEVVVCYDAKTGEERWVHTSPARFSEPVGGVGPRATPTISGDSLYVLGATGLLQRLDPVTGEMKWERDLGDEAKPKSLFWGFASSPLVQGDNVIVYAGGAGDKGVMAFDKETGKPRWGVPAGDHSYGSPKLANVAGRDVILLLTNTGLTAVDAASGKPAWNYEWKYEGYRVVQPLLVDHSGILLGTGMGTGTRRIEVTADKKDVKFDERWTTLDMKPDFNDYVTYKGYLYGLDHNILCCVDLATGKKKWKNGRYGNGQILLLSDAGQLLVLSESGDLVLVRANPDKFDEMARHKVLEGKTWNHPVLVGNHVFVRNAEEAACFEVPLAGQSTGQPVRSVGPQL